MFCSASTTAACVIELHSYINAEIDLGRKQGIVSLLLLGLDKKFETGPNRLIREARLSAVG
jgi:hypothetical protein